MYITISTFAYLLSNNVTGKTQNEFHANPQLHKPVRKPKWQTAWRYIKEYVFTAYIDYTKVSETTDDYLVNYLLMEYFAIQLTGFLNLKLKLDQPCLELLNSLGQ